MDLFSWRSPLLGDRRSRSEPGTVRPRTDSGLSPAPTAPFGDVLDTRGRPPLPGAGGQDPFVLERALAALRRRDPGFDPDALARLAATALVAVEHAWSTLDPQPSRAYMSPALWASHRARMQLYNLQGRRNVVEHVVVQSAHVVAAEQDSGRDRVTVRIRASSTDYDVDRDGTVVRGDTAVRTWEEDWVLERAGDATTRSDGGLLGGRCPACGAPLTLDGDGLCSYCHAAPTDAAHDWVVVTVADVGREEDMLRALLGVRSHVRLDETDTSPADEVVALDLPVGAAPARSDPLAPLRARAPGLDVTEVTAAARTAFVALRTAWGAMDATPLRPVATQATVDALETAIAARRARGMRCVAADPLIDSAEVTAAEAEADGDVVTVRVVAILVDADVDASTGATVSGDTEPRRLQSDLTLRRRHPAPVGDVPRCPRCGAPLRASVSGVCDFCREAVAGGGSDWLLDPLPELTEVAAPAPVASPAPAPSAPGSAADVLRSVDPALNPAELMARARECFYAVEGALGGNRPAQADAWATPRFLATLRSSLDALAAAREHRVLTFIDIAGTRLVDARVDDDGQHAVVRVDVTGADCVVAESGAVVGGSAEQRRWSEDWTLLRRTAGDPWLVDAVGTAPA